MAGEALQAAASAQARATSTAPLENPGVKSCNTTPYLLSLNKTAAKASTSKAACKQAAAATTSRPRATPTWLANPGVKSHNPRVKSCNTTPYSLSLNKTAIT